MTVDEIALQVYYDLILTTAAGISAATNLKWLLTARLPPVQMR